MPRAVRILLALGTVAIALAGYVSLSARGMERLDLPQVAFLPFLAAALAMVLELTLLRRLNRTESGWNPGCLGQQIMMFSFLLLLAGLVLRNSLGGVFLAEKLQWDAPRWGILARSVFFAICELYLVHVFFPHEGSEKK